MSKGISENAFRGLKNAVMLNAFVGAGAFLRVVSLGVGLLLLSFAPRAMSKEVGSQEALSVAEQDLKAGKSAFKQKKYDVAAQFFLQAYQKDSRLVAALFNRGLALKKAGRKAASREAYARYQQVAPGDPDGTFALAEAERLLARDDEALVLFKQYLEQEDRPKKGHYQKFAREKIKILQVRKDLQEADGPKGRSANEALESGTRAFREKRYDEAAATFGEAFAKNPKNTDALYRQALALRKNGRLAEAVTAYQKLRKLDSTHLDALFGLAETLRLQGNANEARTAFRKYLQQEKRAGKERFRAYAERQVEELPAKKQGTRDAAENAAAQEIKAKENAEIAFKKGNDAYQKKKYDEAVTLFEQVLEQDALRVDALYRLALSLRKAKRYAEAKKAYERYNRRVPLDLDGLFGLAETERLMGNHAVAQGLFKRYLAEEKRAGKERFKAYAKEQNRVLAALNQANPNPVSANRNAADFEMKKGLALYKKNKFSEAALHFRAAFDRDRSLGRARLREALAYRKAGLLDDAARTYAEIRQEESQNWDALFGLAETKRLQGEVKKSRALFSAYIAKEDRAERKAYVDYAKEKLAQVPSEAAQKDASGALLRALDDANVHYRAQRYLSAARGYAKALLLEGADESIALKHALSLRKAGHLDEAVMAYEGLLDRETLALDARFGLAESRRLQGNMAEARRHYEFYIANEARPERKSYLKWANEKLATLPRESGEIAQDAPASEHFSEGIRAYQERRFTAAAAAFARAAEQEPQMLDAHYRMALSLRRARRYAEAKKSYLAFLVKKKDDLDALYGLAETERLLGNNKDAKRLFAKYIKLETRESEARYVKRAKMIVEGRSLFGAGLYVAHRPALGQEKAVRAWIEAGESALQKREAFSAQGQFSLALLRQPKNVRARLGLAKALWLSGQSEAANRVFSAIEVEHVGTEAARQAGLWLKRTPKSKRRRKANAQEKDKARALFFRAAKEQAAGANEEAERSLRDGLALHPRAYVQTLLLGDLLLAKNKAGEALLQYQRAAFLNPQGASALLAQAKAYERLGEVGAAQKYYERFVASTADDVDEAEQKNARLWLEGFDVRQPWIRR